MTELKLVYNSNNPANYDIPEYYICGIGTGQTGNWSKTYQSYPARIRVRRLDSDKFIDVEASLDKSNKFDQKVLQNAINFAKKLI